MQPVRRDTNKTVIAFAMHVVWMHFGFLLCLQSPCSGMLIISKPLTCCLQDLRRPEPCSYLQPGQQYQGTQRVSQASPNASEDWGVQVCIEVQLAAQHNKL